MSGRRFHESRTKPLFGAEPPFEFANRRNRRARDAVDRAKRRRVGLDEALSPGERLPSELRRRLIPSSAPRDTDEDDGGTA